MVPMTSTSRDHNGFTLLELMLVVTLIGLLSGIALPTFLSNWEDERLNATTKITVAWLDDLRRKAIQNSVPCRATWDAANSSLSAQCDHETGPSGNLNLKAEISNSENLAVSLGSSDPTIWIFTPRGTSTTDAEAIFTLTGSSSDPGRCLRLAAPLGLIRAAKRTSAGQCDYTTRY
jgi:prepilin-type N-terminal cleavage/methylation domain-containing protein